MNKTLWSERGQALVAFLQAQYGFELNFEKKNKVVHYLKKLEIINESITTNDFLDTIRFSPQLLQNLIADITVPETYFFRFPEQFSFIESKLNHFELNDSISNARLRLWSAGCATGEEPYSLAMLLARKGLLNRVEILASDISEQSLLKAKNPLYSKWSLRDQGERLAIDYLLEFEKGYMLKPEIQQSVRFLFHNLADFSNQEYSSTFSCMDFILCRNVLIYLKADSIRKIFERLINCLVPGGFLITAPVDPVPKDLPVHYIQIDKVGLVLQKPNSNSTHTAKLDSEKYIFKFASENEPINGEGEVCNGTIEAITPITSEEKKPELKESYPFEIIVSELIERGDLQKAISKIQEFLENNLESIETRYTFSILLMKVKHYETALKALRQINYLNANFPEVHFMMGTVHFRLFEYKDAEKAFLRSKKISQKLNVREKLSLAKTTDVGQLLGAIDHELSKLQRLRIKGSQ